MSNNQARNPAELLRLSELFKGIANADLQKLCTHCDMREYSAGSIILDEKAVTGCVFVMDSGVVVISIKENDQTAVLARFLNGECFGELDLFSESGGAVTVRAETDSRLLVFPGNGIKAGKLFADKLNSTVQEISDRFLFFQTRSAGQRPSLAIAQGEPIGMKIE